jgi:hypothetical protein
MGMHRWILPVRFRGGDSAMVPVDAGIALPMHSSNRRSLDPNSMMMTIMMMMAMGGATAQAPLRTRVLPRFTIKRLEGEGQFPNPKG